MAGNATMLRQWWPTHLKGHNTQHSAHMGKKKSQNELMVEIYSKSLVRAIGKILHMKLDYNTN